MRTGDFWEDAQAFLGIADSAPPLVEAELLPPVPTYKDPKHNCPQCGNRVRRWYASADGDGDVAPRAQCEGCEWGF